MQSTPDNLVRPSRPIQNLRITLWGVQGSCPISPTRQGIEEHSRQIALYTLHRTFEDLARRAREGQVRMEDLLGSPPTPEAIARYQQQIGLPDLPFYGGETTCIQVETGEGNILLFDAGSGIRRGSIDIVAQWQNRSEKVLHLFGSHEHLDHRSGLTFARFCYTTPNPFTIHLYGPGSFLHAIDQHYGLFSRQTSEITYIDDPVDYTAMSASVHGIELCPAQQIAATPRRREWERRDLGQPIRIGSSVVQAFEVYHAQTRCLAYRVEHQGKVFVFSTDHEWRRGPDKRDPRQQHSLAAERRLRDMCRDADLVYFDGQYYIEEYLGQKGIGSFPPTSRVDWGHGCIEDAIDRAVECNIRHTLVGHHDPERSWSDRLEIDRRLAGVCAGKPYRIQLADEDQVFDL